MKAPKMSRKATRNQAIRTTGYELVKGYEHVVQRFGVAQTAPITRQRVEDTVSCTPTLNTPSDWFVQTYGEDVTLRKMASFTADVLAWIHAFYPSVRIDWDAPTRREARAAELAILRKFWTGAVDLTTGKTIR